MEPRLPAGYTRRERSAIRRDTSPILALPFPRLSVPRSLTAKMSADFLRRRSGHAAQAPGRVIPAGNGAQCAATSAATKTGHTRKKREDRET